MFVFNLFKKEVPAVGLDEIRDWKLKNNLNI
jgi:hypothetical protein